MNRTAIALLGGVLLSVSALMPPAMAQETDQTDQAVTSDEELIEASIIAAELPTDIDERAKPPAFPMPKIAALKWLSSEKDPLAQLTRVRPQDVPANQSALIELGRVAFRNPALLGGYAADLGISCDSCHTAGRSEQAFYLPPVAPKPGLVDITDSLFSPKGGDGRNNPRPITNLTTSTPPYGTTEVSRTLPRYLFTKITKLFDGPEPDQLVLKALTAYIEALSSPAETSAQPLQMRYRYIGSDKLQVKLMNDELERTFNVLDRVIDEQQTGAALMVVDAIKAAIGRLHERLDLQDPLRDALTADAVMFDTIRTDIQDGKWTSARYATKRIRTVLLQEVDQIETRADLTYFNKSWLEKALTPPVAETDEQSVSDALGKQEAATPNQLDQADTADQSESANQ